ncbi:DnaJ like subfamily C member 9 [Cladophialophora psammophila CBS 110553]|uniref:DnaJ like subfamily C member 9 n=1 Tax=Cladophialophora psammophila CBS 110553 TaxID=1182543 RepID=W9WL47_9EURO|nr:DnaJ like subfamily C member 9 [Cladophialophora psammophila CBS 110553]EXJ68643.1 DnaJ like subfamily C member 9 [Cladophialophora psammophila CBS 110553]
MPQKSKSKPQRAEDSASNGSEKHPEGREDLAVGDPPLIDPYAVLDVSETATPDEIKSSYRKLALKHHPDKASPENRESAHKAFQEIAFAYAILSDERRRKRYDATGNTAESATIDDDDFNWVDFFREQAENMVTEEMIEQVKKEYQGSGEERDDVLAAYTQSEGDMDVVFEMVMCSEVMADEDRFRKIIDEAIAQGEVEAYNRYTKEDKKSRQRRKANAKQEEAEARELAQELGLEDRIFGKKGSSKKKSKAGEGDNDALKALIQQRQQNRAQNFFDDLEAKYGGGTKKGKRKATAEPPEELFQKNAKKGKKGVKA